MPVVVLGANGQLGREVVRHMAARGHKVTAFVRRPANGLFDKTVGIWLGDARNREELIAALPGHDVIVNAIGSGTLRKNDVESNTTAVAVAAAQQVGIPRYIAMSAGIPAVGIGGDGTNSLQCRARIPKCKRSGRPARGDRRSGN